MWKFRISTWSTFGLPLLLNLTDNLAIFCLCLTEIKLIGKLFKQSPPLVKQKEWMTTIHIPLLMRKYWLKALTTVVNRFALLFRRSIIDSPEKEIFGISYLTSICFSLKVKKGLGPFITSICVPTFSNKFFFFSHQWSLIVNMKCVSNLNLKIVSKVFTRFWLQSIGFTFFRVNTGWRWLGRNRWPLNWFGFCSLKN